MNYHYFCNKNQGLKRPLALFNVKGPMQSGTRLYGASLPQVLVDVPIIDLQISAVNLKFACIQKYIKIVILFNRFIDLHFCVYYNFPHKK